MRSGERVRLARWRWRPASANFFRMRLPALTTLKAFRRRRQMDTRGRVRSLEAYDGALFSMGAPTLLPHSVHEPS
jgi:hypothetical protein